MVRVRKKLKVPPYYANEAFVFNKSIELVVINDEI